MNALSKLVGQFKYMTFGVIAMILVIVGCENIGQSGLEDDSSVIDSLVLQIESVNELDISKEEKIDYLLDFENELTDLSNGLSKYRLLAVLGDEYQKVGAFDEFRRLNERTRFLLIHQDDSIGVAESYNDLGRYFKRNGQNDSAFQNYFYAARIYEALGDDEQAGRMHVTMAIIQKNERDYIGGEAISIKAIKLLSAGDDLRYKASANTNLGLISYELGRYDAAIDYHQKALQYRKQLGSRYLEGSSYNNIGLAYMKKGQYTKAFEFYNKGLSVDSLLQKRPKTFARLLDNWAYAKFLSKDTDGLPDEFLGPLKIRDSVGDHLGAVTSHLRLSEYYKSIESHDLSQHHALIALEKARPISYNRGILESLTMLGENPDTEKALGYIKERASIADSLQVVQRGLQDRFARIRFETDSIEIEKDKATKLNRQLIIFALSLGMLFLVIYIFIQRKVARKELEYQLSQQKANEEIYNLMLAQQQKLEEGKQLEKQRISEDLHDGVLGRLFGARLSLDSLNERPDEVSIASRTKYIEELKSIEEEIRQISHNLNADMIPVKLSYIDGIEKLVDDQCRLIGLEYEFNNDTSIDWEAIPSDSKVHLFRIVQEAFQNIRKHANASRVDVGFQKEGKLVCLDVKDDGDGMDVDEVKKGIGLKNMASRVQQLNGAIAMNSQRGSGTQISVKINI